MVFQPSTEPGKIASNMDKTPPLAVCMPPEGQAAIEKIGSFMRVPLVNIKIAGKWMFIPLKMVCIGIDP